MTAVYTPARSFFCEMDFWHPANHSKIAGRLPKTINSMQDLEFLNPNSILPYAIGLASSGHADIHGKKPENEYALRNRHPNTTVISDSGGFQICKGTWKVRLNPMDQKFRDLRKTVHAWQESNSDWAVTLDIPYMIFDVPKAMKITGVTTHDQAMRVIVDNMDYYMSNSTGKCGWLNALQGRTFAETDDYFDKVKDYNTPGYRNDYCRGWAFGNLQSYSAEAMLRRLVILKHRGWLTHTERIHILGKSKLYQTVFFNAIARHFPDIKFTYDSSGPYIQAAKGQLITGWRMLDREKWALNIEPIPWNQQHKSSTEPVWMNRPDIVVSEIFKRLTLGDIIQANNKSGLDAMSYVFLQHHNLDVMLQSQEQAELAFQQGQRPQELDWDVDVETVLAEILQAPTETSALQALSTHSRRLERFSNHRATSLDTFNNLFVEV